MYRPVVIWCLDGVAQSCVADWYDRMADEYKRFVRCAVDWEDIRDTFREFNTVAVAEELLEFDVGRRGDGTRVIVVLVAYGMGEEEACRQWEEAESRLDMLEREVRHVERQRVLLARHSRHRVRERVIVCDGAREVPWLVSDRTSRLQELDEQGFADLLDRLLGVLCFASRSATLSPGVPADDFFLSAPGERSVRLIGVPEVQLDRLVERVATDCAVEMAISLMENVRNEDAHSEQVFTRNIDRVVERIATGQLTVREYERQLFGKDGLGGLDAGELLEHGSRLVERVRTRVKSALSAWAIRQPEVPATQRPGCLLGRLLGWRNSRTRRGRLAGDGRNPMSREVLEAELAPLLSRLTGFQDEIENLKASFYRKRAQRPPRLPDLLRRALRDNLRSQLVEARREWSRGVDEPKSAEEIIEAYLEQARARFDKELVGYLIDGYWAESHPETAKLKLMDQGKFYTFSAALSAGADIPTGAGIVRKDGPSLDSQIFGRVEYYPGTRSEMLLGSRPIPVDQLRW